MCTNLFDTMDHPLKQFNYLPFDVFTFNQPTPRSQKQSPMQPSAPNQRVHPDFFGTDKNNYILCNRCFHQIRRGSGHLKQKAETVATELFKNGSADTA